MVIELLSISFKSLYSQSSALQLLRCKLQRPKSDRDTVASAKFRRQTLDATLAQKEDSSRCVEITRFFPLLPLLRLIYPSRDSRSTTATSELVGRIENQGLFVFILSLSLSSQCTFCRLSENLLFHAEKSGFRVKEKKWHARSHRNKSAEFLLRLHFFLDTDA